MNIVQVTDHTHQESRRWLSKLWDGGKMLLVLDSDRLHHQTELNCHSAMMEGMLVHIQVLDYTSVSDVNLAGILIIWLYPVNLLLILCTTSYSCRSYVGYQPDVKDGIQEIKLQDSQCFSTVSTLVEQHCVFSQCHGVMIIFTLYCRLEQQLMRLDMPWDSFMNNHVLIEMTILIFM